MGMNLGQLIEEPQLLRDILNYHAVNGSKISPTNLTVGQELRTNYGEDLVVTSVEPLTLLRGAGGQNVTVNRTVDAGRVSD
jgi:hypothetical protein